jgi:hypothetical protein
MSHLRLLTRKYNAANLQQVHPFLQQTKNNLDPSSCDLRVAKDRSHLLSRIAPFSMPQASDVCETESHRRRMTRLMMQRARNNAKPESGWSPL